MTPAAVGLRCPDHSGKPRGVARVARAGQGIRVGSRPLSATHVLVALNVLVYLVTVAQGAGLNDPGGRLLSDWLLFGPAVAQGDWWRLITAAFLHGNLLHIFFNMLALWWLGTAVESAIGTTRFLLVYFVSALAGSAGALIESPTTPVVGASGAVFGIMGALLVLEYLATGSLAGQAMGMIVLNLAFSFTVPGIAIGGHIGGLVGGIVATYLFAQFRRSLQLATLSVVAVGALSVAVAFWQVRGYG
jgi:membrane associated rhomboid family serine protease